MGYSENLRAIFSLGPNLFISGGFKDRESTVVEPHFPIYICLRR